MVLLHADLRNIQKLLPVRLSVPLFSLEWAARSVFPFIGVSVGEGHFVDCGAFGAADEVA